MANGKKETYGNNRWLISVNVAGCLCILFICAAMVYFFARNHIEDEGIEFLNVINTIGVGELVRDKDAGHTKKIEIIRQLVDGNSNAVSLSINDESGETLYVFASSNLSAGSTDVIVKIPVIETHVDSLSQSNGNNDVEPGVRTRTGTLVARMSRQDAEIVQIGLFISFTVIVISYLVALAISQKINSIFREPVRHLASWVRGVNRRDLRGNYTGHSKGYVEPLYDEIKTMQDMYVQSLDQSVVLKRDLAKAKREAKEKESVFSSMSHEMRTPIHSMIALIRDLQPNHDSKEASDLYVSAMHLKNIVDNAAVYEKMVRGNLTLTEDAIDFDKLINEISVIAGKMAEARGKTLELSIDRLDRYLLVGDEGAIAHSLLNIIGNAIKFCDTKVTVELNTRIEAERMVLDFYVSDDGPGIDDAIKKAVFSRGKQATTAGIQGEGLGIGLWISKNFAEKLGGLIFVENTKPKGAVFILSLPLRYRLFTKTGTQKKLTAITYKPLPMQVLVVDDDHISSRILTHSLERFGIKYCAAKDGLEAIALLERREVVFDLVLMDCRMQGLDGIETTKRIKRDSDISGIPIVAVTANSTIADREACEAAGMQGFLEKPYTEEDLYREIKSVINTARDNSGDEMPDGDSGLGDKEKIISEMRFDTIDVLALQKRNAASLSLCVDACIDFYDSFYDVEAKIFEDWQSGNVISVSDTVHKIKGRVGAIGAEELRVLCDSYMDNKEDKAILDNLVSRLNVSLVELKEFKRRMHTKAAS